MQVLGDDRGAVTVEAALALCSLVAVMVMAIAAVSAASAHLRCLDAAREVARLVSRGEPQRALEVAAQIAPRGASVDVRTTGDEVHVRVTAAAVPGLPALSLAGVAVGVMEPAALLSTEGPTDPASEGLTSSNDRGSAGAGPADSVDQTAPDSVDQTAPVSGPSTPVTDAPTAVTDAPTAVTDAPTPVTTQGDAEDPP